MCYDSINQNVAKDISLGYYLPKRKPLSAYISDVCAYTSDFATLGQAIGMSLV